MRAKRVDVKRKYDRKVSPKINAMENEKLGSRHHDSKTQAARERFHQPAYCMRGERR